MNSRQKLVQKQFLNNEEAVINQLNQVYSQSLKDINNNIKHLTFDIDKLQTEYDWMDVDDPKRERIKSMIQSKIYQRDYQEAIQKQVEGILNQMQLKQYLTISDYLDGCYTEGFIGTIFDMHGQGVPMMMPIDQEAMVRAVQLDSKISKGLYTRLGEDVDLLKGKITAQVSRSIATGMTFAQTAKQLSDCTRIGFNNAVRIARTEGHRIQCQGTMDACHRAKDMGADVVKQWDATLDDATRESHVAVDGEIRELDKPFSNGLDFPGDPGGKAAEVINCRCALLQRARWALDGSFTKYDNFSGEIKQFENLDTYNDFKKAYFSKENRQYMDYVKGLEEKYGTKNFEKILKSMDDSEYARFIKLQDARPTFPGMYRGDSVIGKTVTDNVVESVTNLKDALTGCKTSAEVSEVARNYFKAKPGCKIQNIDLDSVDVDAAKDMILKLDDLDSRFKSSLTSVKAKSMDAGIGGQCKPNQNAFMKFMDSDDMDDLESEICLNELFLKDKKTIEKDFKGCHRSKYSSLVAQNTQVDDRFMNIATIVHEYGHSILPGKAMELYVNTGGVNHTFTTARRMYRQYMDDLQDLNGKIMTVRESFVGQPDGLQKGIEAAKSLQDQYDTMCVSHYSKESVGEFIAECFCDVELSNNPRPVSLKVYNLLVKSFGKGE